VEAAVVVSRIEVAVSTEAAEVTEIKVKIEAKESVTDVEKPVTLRPTVGQKM
jgi:hypothetical protein